MEILLTRFYYNFPIHFYCYEVELDQLALTFLNEKEKHVSKITVRVNKKLINIDLDTHEKIIKTHIDLKNSNIISKPFLVSCVIENTVYKLDDFPDYLTISQPKSVYSLGIERHLYKQKMAKSLHVPQSDIKYIATKNEFYWMCTCGQSNFISSESCRKCKNPSEKIFATDLHLEYHAVETELEMKYNVNILVWSMIAYFFHISVQAFFGDFLFTNNVKNEFFGVFNRFLVPLLIFLVTLGIFYAQSRYKMKSALALKIIRIVGVLYLNIILVLAFVLTAYNFVFVISLDLIMFAYLFVKARKSYGKSYEFIFIAATCILLVLSSYQLSRFSQYDMTIEPQGIYLNIETEEEIYVIPEEINGINVFEVYFKIDSEYAITDLTISKNLQLFSIYSTGVLPELQIIRIQDGNTAFFIEDNILYYATGIIRLVPMVVEEIFIDSQVVKEGALRDNLNLRTLTIGKNVEIIEKDAFYNNVSLDSLVFEEDSKLEYIGRNAFYNCSSLTSVEIPISVEKMGVGVFEGCVNLTYLKIPFIGEEREYTDILADSSDVLTFQFGSRTYLDNDLIPPNLKYVEIYDIDRIHNVTFYRAESLEEIVLSGTFEYIGIRSFFECTSLQSFIIPSGVEIIPLSAFENCYNLDDLVIPASVTQIDANAFLNCGLANVVYLGNVANLQINAIGNDSLLTALGLD